MSEQRLALVSGNKVMNVIMADPETYKDADGYEIVSTETAEIDWERQPDGSFVQVDVPVAGLIQYANLKQNMLLAGEWHFNLGTADAPLIATTRLDDRGALAMFKVDAWVQRNAVNATARLPYSNIDNTPLSLSPSQAAALIVSVGAVETQSYAVLNDISAKLMAKPPAISTRAEIDAAGWPVPTAQ